MWDLFNLYYARFEEFLLQEIVMPVLYWTGGMGYADDAVGGVDWFVLGLIQVLIIACLIAPLEKIFPAEKISAEHTSARRIAVAIDIFYTLIHRLGLFKLVLFVLFSSWFFALEAYLHDARIQTMNVENWIPGVTSIPWVSFLIYLVIIDFFEYWYHRASHRWNWWWQLHALHHSQRHMTVWSDNRNHVLDDLGHSAFFAFIALAIGVEPIQYIALVALSQLIQSWQHGNLDFDHGILKYMIISPRFHRYHHAIDLGYEVPGKPGVLGGCNFGVLFPWWDMLFKTAIFDNRPYPTGVRQFEAAANPIVHQWQGMRHAWLALKKVWQS